MEYEQNDTKIKIIGIGGGGCNAIKRLSKKKDQFTSVDLYAANTDLKSLLDAAPEGSGVVPIVLGRQNTKGNGAGARPEIGRVATEESKAEIEQCIGDASLLFITAGMGGGTGTGGAPVVAKIANERHILTIGVVTMPFDYEGTEKIRIANAGIKEMRKYVDIIIVVSNQKAFDYCGEAAPMHNIFEKADDVLFNSIKGITDIIEKKTMINLDFADISSVIRGKKTAHIGLGCATGENRMFKALRMASNNELLETTIEGAKNILINIVCDNEITGAEVDKALKLIPKVVSPNAKIIKHGFDTDNNLRQEVHITIIATGLAGEEGEEDERESTEMNEPEELIPAIVSQDDAQEEPVSEEQQEEEQIESIDNLLKKLKERK